MNYYNENDPKTAAWLRELIKAGLIASGEVDERSIIDVKASDLSGFVQCHFFAGIGGWSYALRLAGWPDSEPVWTGSCPCQPLSCAGQRKGHADERHLWPAFYRLISERKPPTVFGEQVASSIGREWFAGIRADMEAMGYAVGGADLCAASVGAPHIRQRLYWLADAKHQRHRQIRNGETGRREPECDSRLGDTNKPGSQGWNGAELSECSSKQTAGEGSAFAGGVADPGGANLNFRSKAQRQTQSSRPSWSQYEIRECLDGKSRRIESGSTPLAHGIPGRVGLLRGYGNAIVPQVAAAFIQAAIEAINLTSPSAVA